MLFELSRYLPIEAMCTYFKILYTEPKQKLENASFKILVKQVCIKIQFKLC